MFRTRKSLRGICTLILCVCAILVGGMSGNVYALPELLVQVGDTNAVSGATNTVISIYLSNYQDSVAGFNLYIQTDRPDIMEFQTDTATVVDTTYWKCLEYAGPDCIDSMLNNQLDYDFTHIDTHLVAVGNIDTVGTLIGGWPSVDGRSLTQTGQDLKIAGVAYDTSDTPTGLSPQQGGLLVKVLADVFSIPDTLTDRTVNLQVIYQPLGNFSFSRIDGSSIGIIHFTQPDTNCWVCTGWVIPDEICGQWERVSIPPPGGCDSIDIDLDTVPMLDTNTVTIFNGSLTILTPPPYICGNCDGIIGFGGPVDVADLSYLVGFLFQGGPAPDPYASADMDCSGTLASPDVSVADLTYIVAYLFQGGAPPCDGCTLQ